MLDNVPLLIILVLSVLGQNQSVAVAAGLLLVMKLLGLETGLALLESHGINAGVTLMTIAVLVPLATGRVSISDIGEVFKSPIGLIALACGLFVAWAAGRGIVYIHATPDMVTALVLGTVVGVCFLNGVAVGPLVAGGLTSLAVLLFKLMK